jgi:hypothetical protein
LTCFSSVSSSKMADMSVDLKFVRNPAASTTFAYWALSFTIACISAYRDCGRVVELKASVRSTVLEAQKVARKRFQNDIA